METFDFSLEEQTLLDKAGVEALILFGSRAQGLARSESDFDIGVLGSRRAGVYDFIYELVSNKINQLVNIDIVFLDEAPMELRTHVATYGRGLYQSSANVFADFRQRTMIEAADFSPLRTIFSAATLARISP